LSPKRLSALPILARSPTSSPGKMESPLQRPSPPMKRVSDGAVSTNLHLSRSVAEVITETRGTQTTSPDTDVHHTAGKPRRDRSFSPPARSPKEQSGAIDGADMCRLLIERAEAVAKCEQLEFRLEHMTEERDRMLGLLTSVCKAFDRSGHLEGQRVGEFLESLRAVDPLGIFGTPAPQHSSPSPFPCMSPQHVSVAGDASPLAGHGRMSPPTFGEPQLLHGRPGDSQRLFNAPRSVRIAAPVADSASRSYSTPVVVPVAESVSWSATGPAHPQVRIRPPFGHQRTNVLSSPSPSRRSVRIRPRSPSPSAVHSVAVAPQAVASWVASPAPGGVLTPSPSIRRGTVPFPQRVASAPFSDRKSL